MKKLSFKYYHYLLLLIFLLIASFLLFTIFFNQSIKYGFDKSIPYQLDREGPFIALEGDSMAIIHYITGNQKNGFGLQSQKVSWDSTLELPIYYPLDNSEFQVILDFDFQNQPVWYPPSNKIFAVSDMEGNFNTFRNILSSNNVIDNAMNWSFGDGHLVLCGDFMDKGFFVTQTLWYIYKLEQEAEEAGGKVHFILGNHDINNLQGYHGSTAHKYWFVTNVLGLKRYDFYGPDSFLGRWLTSKNVVEKIGSFVFVHGGLHPDFANHDISLEQINQRIRSQYRTPYYHKIGEDDLYDLLHSTKKSPSWYRGYFRQKLQQDEIDKLTQKFEATMIIAGHTTRPKVEDYYIGKVIGIDVKSPLDHYKYFPARRAEALLFENGKWFRVNDSGMKKQL